MMKQYLSRGNDFLKTRIESMGFAKRVIDILLKSNIRTIGGIISRTKDELQQMGLSSSDTEQVFKKIDNFDVIEKTEDSPTILANPTEQTVMTMIPSLDGDDDIINTLAKYFGYEKDDVTARSRKQELVRVRDLITYLLRKHGDMSYPAIGRILGGRDHTTVIHSCNKIREEVESRPELEKQFTELIGKVREIKERKLRIKKELMPEILTSSHAESTIYRKNPVFKEIPDRDMKVLELWREGLTLANIGTVVGVSRERVRQVVSSTVKQLGTNESISKGIIMDSKVLIEEETKKRHRAQEEKKGKGTKTVVKKERWSRYYVSCKSCGTTSIPQIRKGLCEQCLGQFRGDRRENIIDQHNNKCDVCGRNRYEATALFRRDFYITKDRKVLCRKCFTQHSGKILGGYKNFDWSRFYEKCLKCSTQSIPHAKKGLCENCIGNLTLKQRQRIMAEHGSRCDRCEIQQEDAQHKYGRDLYVTRNEKVLCKSCFQKRNIKISRESKTRALKE